jgi:imidazolonepropionase-like amidohydrolase
VTELPSATLERSVWIRVGTLLDGTSSAPSRDAHVVYNGAEILFVGGGGRTPPRELLRAGQDAPDVDAPDLTMLPGLIEAHAHLFLEGGELDLEKRAAYIKQSPAELLSAARVRLPKLVRLGVAGVRDAGDKDGVGLALSKLCAGADRPLMPYVESPGAAIYHKGRYGSFMGDPIENYASPRDCVEARVKSGSDRIKLIPTGIINFKKGLVTTEPQMTTQEITQLVAAAKSFGRQTFAHSSGDSGIDRVIDGGVDSIEHGFFMRDDQLPRMRDRGTAWVPTFSPVREQVDHADVMGWDAEVVSHLEGILDRHGATLVKAHRMGVLIVAGSDAGSVGVAHGLGLIREMELMQAAGLPPIAVVNAATGIGSDRFAYRERLGRIEAGYLSRFILTKYSPAETVANLRRPRWVVFDGTAHEAGEVGEDKGL